MTCVFTLFEQNILNLDFVSAIIVYKVTHAYNDIKKGQLR